MAKFRFNTESEVYDLEDFENVMYDRYGDSDALEQYTCESIDELHNKEVVIGNLTFAPSRIVQELDPTAFSMWMDECLDDICETALDSLDCGNDYTLWDGTKIHYIDDGEDEEEEDE